MGICWAWQRFKTGRYAEAAEAFAAVLKMDKGSALDMANLGLCHKFLGQKEEAARHLQAALELDPTLDFARRHLQELRFNPPTRQMPGPNAAQKPLNPKMLRVLPCRKPCCPARGDLRQTASVIRAGKNQRWPP